MVTVDALSSRSHCLGFPSLIYALAPIYLGTTTSVRASTRAASSRWKNCFWYPGRRCGPWWFRPPCPGASSSRERAATPPGRARRSTSYDSSPGSPNPPLHIVSGYGPTDPTPFSPPASTSAATLHRWDSPAVEEVATGAFHRETMPSCREGMPSCLQGMSSYRQGMSSLFLW